MKKYEFISIKIMLVIGLLFIGTLFMPVQMVSAAGSSVQVFAVAYSDESIYVLNNGNTKIYFATEIDASKGNWEVVLADTNPEDLTMLDLSWLSPSTENIIRIKGNLDETESRVILNERPRKLEVTINYGGMDKLDPDDTIASLVNIMTSEGSGAKPIKFEDLQWKKGTGGIWTSTDKLTVGLLEKYLIKGTYLYFRIKPINDVAFIDDSPNPDIDISESTFSEFGTLKLITSDPADTIPLGIIPFTDFPDGTDGRRFSNEIKIKVSKTSAPMVYGIDGTRFTAEIKYGKEYRVTVTNGTSVTSDWVPIINRTTKFLKLEEMINYGTSDGTIPANKFPNMKIEIRNYATTKAAASKISERIIEEQRTIDNAITEGLAPEGTDATDDNIYVAYNGIKNMIITIPSASVTLPYEYCVVKPTDTFRFDRVVWTSISKGTAVKILASKAVEGGTLYVRQKEIKSRAETKTSDAIEYALASTYVTHNISYPSIPIIEKQTITYTKKYPPALPYTFVITLNGVGKEPFETEIRNIRLGTRVIDYSASTISTDANGVQTITVTLISPSLEAMTNTYNRYISINFMNGTVNKTSVLLTIRSAIPATGLTASPAKGPVGSGATIINLVTAPAPGNIVVYQVGTLVSGVTTDDIMLSGTTYDPAVSIPVTDGQYITLYEIKNDGSGSIVKFKSIPITAVNIG